MRQLRLLVVVGGLLLPYAALLINVRMFPTGLGPVVLVGGVNMVCWLSVLAACSSRRTVESAAVTALIGFAFPAFAYATTTSPLAMIYIPFMNLPFVLVGWFIGRYLDDQAPDE